jgi:non-heme chloroperoxidase
LRMIIALLAILLVTLPAPAFSQTGLGYTAPMPHRQVPDDGWRDPAPHRAFGVNVERGVRLHVLDFGGTGTPLVFLSGIGNNAHVFDDFGQRFTKEHHVVAITRRGFGESSRPDSGYDQATLAADVIAVLDTMGIRKAVLVGHSIGGYELTHIGAKYPERVIGLIYLDGGADPVSADSIRRAHAAELAALDGLPKPPPAVNPPPLDADSASPKAAWAYRVRNGLTDNTESAVRAAYFYEGFNPYLANKSPVPPKMLAEIRRGGPTPFAKVTAPALFIMAGPDSIRHPTDVNWVITREQREYIVRQLTGSRMVTIPGARHLIFFSHPDEVERLMKEFLSSLQAK